jgi:benzoate-CoA ligase
MLDFTIPASFNIATYLVDRHLKEGRGEKIAVYYKDERITYQQIAERVNRAGNALQQLGIERENRVLVCLPDSPEFIAVYFGAIKIGAVPVPVNTMASVQDYIYYLNDSRAKVLVTQSRLWESIAAHKGELIFLKQVVLVDDEKNDLPNLHSLLDNSSPNLEPAATSRNDMAFWLYSSGTTGTPKGVIHLHHDLPYFMRPFCQEVLHLSPEDTAFSISKLFFSYGRNNSLDSIFLTGASVVLSPDPPRPENVLHVLQKYKPTLFYSVPSSYAAILEYIRKQDLKPDLHFLRLCISAGEDLPPIVSKNWHQMFGLEILNGVGSSDVGAIYLSNMPGEVRLGSAGKLLPHFEAKLTDEDGQEIDTDNEIGTLWIKNQGTTPGYWNKHSKTKEVICHDWFCTGDQFSKDPEGFFWYSGRQDDMLKPGGIWLSPLEVENVLLEHPAVKECAVIGVPDANGLEKPLAFVVIADTFAPVSESSNLEKELQEHVKNQVAHYKYPRWVHFVTSLPRTVTGKIQRYKLRALIEND